MQDILDLLSQPTRPFDTQIVYVKELLLGIC